MKKLLLPIAFMLFFSGIITAQDSEFEYYKDNEIKTLFGKDRSVGFYASFSTGYTAIENQYALLFGGRISWITNHTLGIGFGGTGFINEYHYDALAGKDLFLTGGYGGLYIEPILFPKLPVHLSFPTLFGAGGISYVSDRNNFDSNFIEDSEVFLLIEPSAEIELNLTKFFRLGMGSSYRFPTPFNIGLTGSPIADAKSLKGVSYLMTFKFGKF